MLPRYDSFRFQVDLAEMFVPVLMETGKSRDGLYDNVLADSEREAVADLLQYLENVRSQSRPDMIASLTFHQRAETDFFAGDPLRALSTLVFSENIDLQHRTSSPSTTSSTPASLLRRAADTESRALTLYSSTPSTVLTLFSVHARPSTHARHTS